MATKRHLFVLISLIVLIGWICYLIDEYVGDWAFIPLVILVIGGFIFSRS